ncbi:MAG TPA: CHASE3 domain-containing protein, partial [Acidobacteriota bacterium]
MKWTVGTKIVTGFALALAVLVIIGVVSYRSVTKLIETADHVTHTHQMLETLEELFSLLKDVHRGGRGYVITGDESFLEPYTTAIEKIDPDFEALVRLTSDNENQRRRLVELKPLITDALAGVKETIVIRREKGLEQAIEKVKTGQ